MKIINPHKQFFPETNYVDNLFVSFRIFKTSKAIHVGNILVNVGNRTHWKMCVGQGIFRA